MDTKLTVPIAAKDIDQAIGQAKAAQTAGAEMLELRFDYLEELSVELAEKLINEVKATAKLPLIATCRDTQQGGAKDYPLNLRVEVLVAALKAGAEFIDFEYENFLLPQIQGKITAAVAQSLSGKLILSIHNFESKFDNISKLHRHVFTLYPAAIPKLVYTANHINDCFEAFDLLHKTSEPCIAFCMGRAGLISRIIAKKLGCFVTFAALEEKTATAAGQLTIEQLKNLYRWDTIDTDTDLYGVIADPVAHSLSPAVHNACFTQAKVNGLYLPLFVEGGKDEFDSFMRNVLLRDWLGFRGFSVTIPHKANALDCVKEKEGVIEPLAEKIGAVNTLVIDKPQTINHEPQISAYNTDYAGALDAVSSALKIKRKDLKDMPVAVIGAGGVARAIVAGLSDVGARVKIYNRTVKRAEKLADEFGCDFASLDELAGLNAELLINCTSIGMHPKTDASPVLKNHLKNDMVVFDTVYNPAETLLLKQASDLGAKTIDGVSMFVNQACVQFKLFTGKKANAELMRKTIKDN